MTSSNTLNSFKVNTNTQAQIIVDLICKSVAELFPKRIWFNKIVTETFIYLLFIGLLSSKNDTFLKATIFFF